MANGIVDTSAAVEFDRPVLKHSIGKKCKDKGSRGFKVARIIIH